MKVWPICCQFLKIHLLDSKMLPDIRAHTKRRQQSDYCQEKEAPVGEGTYGAVYRAFCNLSLLWLAFIWSKSEMTGSGFILPTAQASHNRLQFSHFSANPTFIHFCTFHPIPFASLLFLANETTRCARKKTVAIKRVKMEHEDEGVGMQRIANCKSWCHNASHTVFNEEDVVAAPYPLKFCW